MGMSKEEQAAAARRILAKDPLTPEEGMWAEFYKLAPGAYTPPTKAGVRTCGVCRAEFEDIKPGTREEVTALQQFCDHWAEKHQAKAGQWTEVYHKLQEIKSRSPKE